jgi:hypothetical protein
MKPPDLLPQTYKLPLGYVVTFQCADGRLSAEWQPYEPRKIKSLRDRQKFLEAYSAARAEFARSIATVMGGSVLVVDTHDVHGKPNMSATAIEPAKLQ